MADSPGEPSELEILLPRDLAAASTRLILTRWAAGALVILATLASQRLLGVVLPAMGLYSTGLAILIYNSILSVLAHRAPRLIPPSPSPGSAAWSFCRSVSTGCAWRSSCTSPAALPARGSSSC